MMHSLSIVNDNFHSKIIYSYCQLFWLQLCLHSSLPIIYITADAAINIVTIIVIIIIIMITIITI